MIMIKMKMETITMMKVMISANNLTTNNAFCLRPCYGDDDHSIDDNDVVDNSHDDLLAPN